MHGEVPHLARRRHLVPGPVQRHVHADGFDHTLAQIPRVGLERQCALRMQGAHAHGRQILDQPSRHDLARTARRQDAVGIESRGDIQAAHLSRRTQVRAAVRREALRAAEEQLHADVVERGDPIERLRENRLHVLQVGRQLLEGKAGGILAPPMARPCRPPRSPLSAVCPRPPCSTPARRRRSGSGSCARVPAPARSRCRNARRHAAAPTRRGVWRSDASIGRRRAARARQAMSPAPVRTPITRSP